jgi:hypothetical protein
VEGFTEEQPQTSVLWFDLRPTEFYTHLKGRLLIHWPPSAKYPLPFRKWDRWANEWELPTEGVCSENALGAAKPDWEAVDPCAEGLFWPPAPGHHDTDSDGSPRRALVTGYRVLRDTPMAKHVKELHDNECQICGETLLLLNGLRYAEAHHIKSLGAPHNGPDRAENVLCVCPNHHAALDLKTCEISVSMLRTADGHTIGQEFIDYHNKQVSGLLAECSLAPQQRRRQ